MTLNLNLPPELEKSLSEAAQQQGISVESLALDHLIKFVDDGKNALKLLRFSSPGLMTLILQNRKKQVHCF